MTRAEFPAPLIRTLENEDLDGLLALYVHLHEGEDLPPSRTLADLWSTILRDPAQTYVGAFVGGMLGSVANASIVPNLTRGGRPFAVIENVVTHPSYRRRGLAKLVMSHLLEICELRGCYKVMLLSSASRAEAHALYRSLGFNDDTKRAFIRRFAAQ